MVSNRTLSKKKKLPSANTNWVLDSGGFSELSMYGEWRTSRDEYIRNVQRYSQYIGFLHWIAPQDWMCEPFILKKTGLTIPIHQELTIDSVIALRSATLTVNVIPVLQGFTLNEYMNHIEQYTARGIDLTKEDTVGIGSICRRQATSEIGVIISSIARLGINIHGFGVKTQGIRRYKQHLVSADSMAWSLQARRGERLPWCIHKNCANCFDYALLWRDDLLGTTDYRDGKAF